MSCTNPITNAPYQIGDTGPGGGIIFSIPGQGNNSTNYYFEAAPVDVSTTQRAQVSTTLGQTQAFDCTGIANAIPGAEFGVHKEIISPTDNGQFIGDGSNNTIHLNSYPTSWGGYTGSPTNPVLDIHDLAAQLCVDYAGPNGTKDWFLPSLTEMTELVSNLGPNSVINNIINIADLSTSTSHPASAFYWTSSVLAGPPGTVFDTIAAGVNVVAGNPQIMDRCSTASVRPIRMFKCTSSPGIDYNYRWKKSQGLGVGFPAEVATTGYWQSGHAYNQGPWDTIGYPWLTLYINKRDTLLNSWHSTYGPSNNMSGKKLHIKIWDIQENFIGHWEYEWWHVFTGCPTWNGCSVKWKLKNGTHISGSNSIVNLDLSIGGRYYIKFERHASSGIINNNKPFGNTANLDNYLNSGVSARGLGLSLPMSLPWEKYCVDDPNCYPLGCYPWRAEVPPNHVPAGASNPIATMASIQLQPAGTLNCCSLPPSKLSNPSNLNICEEAIINCKAHYIQNDNQTVEVVGNDSMFLTEEENGTQKILKFSGDILLDSTKNIFNITFKTNEDYYYSKSPSLNMNFPGSENYKIKVESESKNANGYVIEKTFNISYKNTGFDVLEEDGHNIIFTNKITKEVVKSTEMKEITALLVDKFSIDSAGDSRDISIIGTPGSTFSLTIKDKNGRNVLPYTNSITKTVKTIASASATLELNDARNLEIGMVVLNDQRRGVKITGISDPVKTNVDAINETSTTYITISSHLTFAVDDSITFAKEGDITEVAIPDSGTYSFTQRFPVLEKFKRTLKTVASGTTSLDLDYNDDLEDSMKITGTGVDGNDPIISSNGVNADGVTVAVSDSQTIADETELSFEMPDNRYDITIQPLMALLNSDVLSTCSIYQYVNPIVQISPSSALANVTTAGTITLTGKANRTAGANGNITINMTAIKSDGNLEASREPRFSSIDSEASDFSNTLNTVTKTIREGDLNDRSIIHLNNVAGIRVGMVVTGSNIDIYETVTVKSIVGTTVELSSKQTTQKDDILAFSSMFDMNISGLTATFSANGGLPTGTCTITGKGTITTFGIDSFTSTLSLDNFLSIV
jgi:hypothetical protein